MKRDLNLLRAILLKVEAYEKPTLPPHELTIENHDEALVAHHAGLLVEAGFLSGGGIQATGFGLYCMEGFRLTMMGYDFLETIRDPDIWSRTKSAANKIGGASLELLWEIAKEVAKEAAKVGFGLGS